MRVKTELWNNRRLSYFFCRKQQIFAIFFITIPESEVSIWNIICPAHHDGHNSKILNNVI